MVDINDLMAATYADDEPAMAKIIDKMITEELQDFRRYLTILNNMSHRILCSRVQEINNGSV
jgi:hypothetical protein